MRANRIGARMLLATPILVLLVAAPLIGGRHSPDERDSAASAAAAWPGWRGQMAEGRSAARLPTQWTAVHGVLWKTPIPGRGHSSPIAFADAAYVTTAYETVDGWATLNAFEALTVMLVVIVAGLAWQPVWQREKALATGAWHSVLAHFSADVMTMLVVVLAVVAEPWLEVGRSPIRQWIASTLFVSLCLALSSLSVQTRAMRRGVSVAAIIFSAFTLTTFPFSDYVFRGGLNSLRQQIAVSASSLPFLIGVCTIISTISFQGRTRSRLARFLAVAFAVGLVAGGWFLLDHLVTFRDDSFPDTAYTPRVTRWLLLLPGAALAVAWRRGQPATVHARVMVLLAALSFIVVSACGLEFVAERSPYLAYQLGGSGYVPAHGTSMMAVGVASGCLLICVVRRSWPSLAHHPWTMPVVTMALASVFFVKSNYLQPTTDLARAIVSIDRGSGQVVWAVEGLVGSSAPVDGRNSPATPTPVTDGRIVCAYFGTPGLMCASRDGQLLWSRRDLPYEGLYGPAASPVLADGILVVVRDLPEGTAHVDALVAETGRSLWSRTFRSAPTFSGNSRTPLIRRLGDRTIVVLWGMNYVKALALDSGEGVFDYTHASSGDLVSSAVSDDTRLYLTDASGTVAMDYSRLLSGRDPVLWRSRARANCVSPVLSNGLLFAITDSGVATATRVETGEAVWRQRLPGQYFASLLASPEAVYFTNSDGLTTVVAARDAFHVIATNHIEDSTLASFAAAGDGLLIRSSSHLYAIGHQRSAKTTVQ